MSNKIVRINKDYSVEEFSAIVRSVRRQNGWSQKELVDKVYSEMNPGESPSKEKSKAVGMVILRIENAMNPPSEDYKYALCKVLGLDKRLENDQSKDLYTETIIDELRMIIKELPAKRTEGLLKLAYMIQRGEL